MSNKSAKGNDPNLQKILAELASLRAEVDSLKKALAKGGINVKECKTLAKSEKKGGITRDDILADVRTLTQPLPEQKRYKDISLEQIAKEKKPKRKMMLQEAYDTLASRRLLTAKYRPKKGWKFDFEEEGIPLLYRIDNRNSIVCNTRLRPLKPIIGEDGKVLKEMAMEGQNYLIPYGLDNLDYSYKTIFVAEGCYDSHFLKNCVAQSNWILPTPMCDVIDIYRNAGFQIIHVPDNFRIGDKGGLNFIHHVIKKRDWLSKGDRVFNWSIYSDCDDLNTIAMKYGLDEIDAQSIIKNSWGAEEVQENYDKQFAQWLDILRKKIGQEKWENFVAGFGV